MNLHDLMTAKTRKTKKIDEAGYGQNRGYAQGFASPTAPTLGRSGREDDEGNSEYDDKMRKLTGMIFYNVNDPEMASALGLKQTRTGKWFLSTGNRNAQQAADKAFGAGKVWYPKNEGVAEGEEMGTFAALKDWQVWDVHVFNNFYRGKYADYGPRLYSVVAGSPDEARQVIINNPDYVLQDLLSRKLQNGKKVLPRGSALPIEDKRVGKAQPGTITTMALKKMLTPDGVQSFKFSNGKIVDGAHVAGGEQVEEASFDYTMKDLGNDYAGFPSNHSMKHKFLAKIKPEKQQLYKDKINNTHEWDDLFALFNVAKDRGDIIEQDVEEARRANTDSARAEFSNRPRKPGLSPAEQDKAKADSDAAWERLMAYADEQKKKEQGLNEFAPGAGGGESGRWYTDDQMTDLVGDGWWQDLDISGDVSKQEMMHEAQAWLADNGYRVQVLNVKVNDDDCEWFIEGSFQNNRFAKKGVAEGNLNEFAPGNDDDNGGDDDALLRFAKMWYAAPDVATQQKVEQALAKAGWEIGELESEEGGAYVMRIGDEAGDSYIGWSEEQLADISEGAKSAGPGWMLRQDPVLAQKVKDAKAGHQALKKWAGKPVPNKFNDKPDDWSQDFERRMSEDNNGFDTHIVLVTVSDPNATAVTQRGETVQKRARVRSSDRESAINTAIKHYKKAGYKVIDHHYVGAIRSGATPHNEDTDLNELSNELLGRYKKELGVRASAADKAGDYDKGHEYFKKINRATIRQGENDARKHEREEQNEMMETRLNMMRKAGYDL